MADGDVQSEHLQMKIIDKGTQKTKMTFGESSTVTLAKAFLSVYSSGKIYGAQISQKLECATVEPDDFDDSDVDDKLTITAVDAVTGENIRFVIPAYLESESLVLVPGADGRRLDETTGQAICDAWKTANALDNALVFMNGTPTRRP